MIILDLYKIINLLIQSSLIEKYKSVHKKQANKKISEKKAIQEVKDIKKVNKK